MRTIISFVVGVFVVLALAISAEAQNAWDIECNRLDTQANMAPRHSREYLREAARQCWTARWDHYNQQRSQERVGGYGYLGQNDRPYYGGYDPRMQDPRLMDPCFEAQQYYEGIRGTFHFDKVDGGTEKHFHACDPSQNLIKTREAGVYGGLAGAGIGAVIGGKKGAVIGAVIGAGGSGYLASRKGHDDCVVVDFIPKGGKVQNQLNIEQGGGAAPISYREQVQQPIAAGPVDPLANITWQTVNTTNLRAVVTDPNLPENHPKKRRLIVGGGSMSLPEPAGEQPYTVVLLDPGSGKSIPIPAVIRASRDLQGWEIVTREES